MTQSTVVDLSQLVWSGFWFVLLAVMLAGIVFYVLAIVRWQMNSWKYLLLIGIVFPPFVAAIAGWIALFTGNVRTTAG